MRIWVAALFLSMAGGVWGQNVSSLDRRLAPRASILTGTNNYPSAKGVYVVTFPAPNECVEFAPVKAGSRSEALVLVVQSGGFTLKASNAGLTVWTIEEWNAFKAEAPEYWKLFEDHCKPK